ncbi:MAG: hypothetical protein DWQ34_06110 [Planctomycetota bacterium]|nr:MAG: hypothetical protein DWQ34_06110 [Planctomycetota bacterium]REK26531.1 MAG: hypothetical protein DWQ41_09710 [Planctomycetota bacterium]REK33984.1 MAG: hypothetical protein DWQ45_14265 [Planctomycetota bacterium]
MSDLADLSTVSGTDLTAGQIKGILAQIDLDITNLVRDGKLSALKYSVGGAGGQRTDRAANLKALLDARAHYERLLAAQPGWEISQATCESD